MSSLAGKPEPMQIRYEHGRIGRRTGMASMSSSTGVVPRDDMLLDRPDRATRFIRQGRRRDHVGSLDRGNPTGSGAAQSLLAPLPKGTDPQDMIKVAATISTNCLATYF